MLILGRREGEKVVIMVGDNAEIEVTVVRNERGQLALGFEADRKYKIVRSELMDNKSTQRSR